MSKVVRAWRWGLILGPILVLALAFRSVWTLRVTAAHPDAEDMAGEATRVAGLVDEYLKRVAGVTSFLTFAPGVLKLAEDSSKLPLTKEEEAINENWGNQAGNERFNAIKAQPVSMFFKDLKATGGAFREIFLTDKLGRVIAASNRTENFLQAKDPWWPKDAEDTKASCRQDPMVCVRFTGVSWDPGAAVSGYAVVLPVLTPEGQWVGVLKAVVDPKELDSLLKFAASNQEADIALVNVKGKRLNSPKPFFSDEEAAAARLAHLTPEHEDSFPTGKNGPVAFVRRLSSPLDGGWSVAVADREEGDPGLWKPYLLWCLFTLGVFFVSARAFAITAPRRAQAAEKDVTS